jgi:hypothetical protein
MLAGMKDMLNIMSKFLNMGMSLEAVVLRSTWNLAHEIRREELEISPWVLQLISLYSNWRMVISALETPGEHAWREAGGWCVS